MQRAIQGLAVFVFCPEIDQCGIISLAAEIDGCSDAGQQADEKNTIPEPNGFHQAMNVNESWASQSMFFTGRPYGQLPIQTGLSHPEQASAFFFSDA